MSSVHKLAGKLNWFCFYTDRTGKRRCRSMLTRRRREAEQLCVKLQEIERRAAHITPDRARRVIEQTVEEIMESFGSPIERAGIADHFQTWLASFKSTRSSATYARYAGVTRKFMEFLGPKAARPLASLLRDDIEAYRDQLSGSVASRTVNTHLKVIRVALNGAVKKRVFEFNPARLVENVHTADRHERRGFTLGELKRLLAVAGAQWRTAILFGIYTGFRLGDIVGLTWANLDLQEEEVAVRTQKTGRFQRLPLARPLLAHLESLDAGDDPKAPLCPSMFGKRVSWLSGQFHDLMATAGLVQPRGDHQKKLAEGSRRRRLSTVSFHSLRHTATSLLKNSGASDVVARDIIGHESEAISRNYTHIESRTKRKALNKLPDVTK
jgi:integrase